MNTNKDDQVFLVEVTDALPITKRVNELLAEVAASELAFERAKAAVLVADGDLARQLRAGASDAMLNHVEEAVRHTNRDVHRQGLVLEQARRDLQVALVTQKVEVDDLPRRIAAVKAVNAHCLNLVLTEYPKLAEPLKKLLGTLAAADAYLQQNRVPGIPYFNNIRHSDGTGWSLDCLSVSVYLPRVMSRGPDLWTKARHGEFQTNCLKHLRDAGLEVGPRTIADVAA